MLSLFSKLRKAQLAAAGAISRRVPAIALLLAKGSVDTIIEDKAIAGFVSLYGEESTDGFTLTGGDVDRLKAILRKVPLPFDHSESMLHVFGNRLLGILVSPVALEVLRKFEENNEVQNRNIVLYKGCIFTDNAFGKYQSQVLGGDVRMASNQFAAEDQVVTVVAETAIYTGNSAVARATLMSCSRADWTKEAVNLLIIV